jgi:hypothetical protein
MNRARRTHPNRIRPTSTRTHKPAHSRELAARLADRRAGGLVVVNYLFDLFAASPLEGFSRLSVLAVLDQVRKDKAVFPDEGAVVPSSFDSTPQTA